ncbi:hypothetical protein [Brevibacillus agri]|uniref:hypothetical protein n=1 Tax=Brevibacillus agri TaxID=51101 RepID=UPI00286831DF|nr:hypothetical protein [Brevibacillus agri]
MKADRFGNRLHALSSQQLALGFVHAQTVDVGGNRLARNPLARQKLRDTASGRGTASFFQNAAQRQ